MTRLCKRSIINKNTNEKCKNQHCLHCPRVQCKVNHNQDNTVTHTRKQGSAREARGHAGASSKVPYNTTPSNHIEKYHSFILPLTYK